MAEKQILAIRAPFEAVDSSSPSDYTITTAPGDVNRVTVAVKGVRRGNSVVAPNLLPVFPGELTFKPVEGAAIPPDPSTVNAGAITGNLYLQLSGAAAREYDKKARSVSGSVLVMAYLGVTLTSSFFRETVLKGVGGSQSSMLSLPQPLSAPQLAHAFAKGLLSVNIAPTAEQAIYPFPSLPLDQATASGSVTLALAVRQNYDPFVVPKPLVELSAAEITVGPDFAPVSPLFWYQDLRHLGEWESIAAKYHRHHPFYDSIERRDEPQGRVRRLRFFLHSERSDGWTPIEAFDGLTAHALDGNGKTLWSQPLNRLGTLFVERRDNEAFRLELRKGATPVPLAREPDDAPKPQLQLQWSGGADQALRRINISAHLDVTGDPLNLLNEADPRIRPEERDLGLFMYDAGGLTIDPVKKRIFAHRELVRPLQRMLAGLGFGVAKDQAVAFGADQLVKKKSKGEAGSDIFQPMTTRAMCPIPSHVLTRKFAVYDIATSHAVREFQREASTTARMAGGSPVSPAEVTPFTGAISGVVNQQTADEIKNWRARNYRSAVTFSIVKGGATTSDVGFPDRQIVGARVLDGSKAQLGTVEDYFDKPTKKRPVGITSFGETNPRSNGSALRKEVLEGAPGLTYRGAKWEKRAILAVCFNESKTFDSLNSYDIAYLSMGLFQWTIGKQNEQGELPANCSTKHIKQEDFDRLFKPFGLEVVNYEMECGRPIATFKLDNVSLTPALKEEFRGFRWAHRFKGAFQDSKMHQAQYDSAYDRLARVLATTISFGGVTIAASELLQSEFLRAVALDLHVNAPCVLKQELQGCATALKNPKVIIDVSGDRPVGDWYDRIVKPALMKKCVEKKKKKIADLTDEERAEVDDALKPALTELYVLRLRCDDSSRPDARLSEAIQDLGVRDTEVEVRGVTSKEKIKDIKGGNTAALAVAGGKLATMSQAQHDALAALFKWRRENTAHMIDPDGRWNNIAAGGYDDGKLGKLLTKAATYTE